MVDSVVMRRAFIDLVIVALDKDRGDFRQVTLLP